MSQRKDYYKILSLDRSASIRDIKRVRSKVQLGWRSSKRRPAACARGLQP